MVSLFFTLSCQLCTPPLPVTHMTVENLQMKEGAVTQYKQ